MLCAGRNGPGGGMTRVFTGMWADLERAGNRRAHRYCIEKIPQNVQGAGVEGSILWVGEYSKPSWAYTKERANVQGETDDVKDDEWWNRPNRLGLPLFHATLVIPWWYAFLMRVASVEIFPIPKTSSKCAARTTYHPSCLLPPLPSFSRFSSASAR